MEDYQKRVVAEKEALDDKIGRLRTFLESPKIEEVDPEERRRLIEQEGYMSGYSAVLGRRIMAFTR